MNLQQTIKNPNKINLEELMGFAVLFAVLVFVTIIYYPVIVNKYVINDDARQHLFWIYQFQDSELFQNDLLTRYSKGIQPIGFVLLYQLSALFLDPILASKLLTIIVYGLTAYYLYKFVTEVDGVLTGLLAVAVYCATPVYLVQMIGGNARAFGFLVMIMFLYYFQKKNYPLVFVSLIAQTLFYPLIFIVCGLASFFSMFKLSGKKLIVDFDVRKIVWLSIAAIICCSILFFKNIYATDSDIGPVVSYEQMKDNPDYATGSRKEILPIPPIYEEMNSFINSSVFTPKILKSSTGKVICVLFVIALFLIDCLRMKRQLPAILLYLLFASVTMFYLAEFMVLKLYIPNRYLEYSIQLTILILVCMSISHLFKKIKASRIRIVLMAITFAYVLMYVPRNEPTHLLIAHQNRSVLEYIKTLPKDTLIAAHPTDGDWIPIYSKRKVFLMHELSHAIYLNYWKKIKQRTYDFFRMYYSDSFQEIYVFCEANDVDYILVNKIHFLIPYILQNNFYFVPFNEYIHDLIYSKSSFALAMLPQEFRSYDEGPYYLVEKKRVLQLALLERAGKITLPGNKTLLK